ncbi:MAG: hypothetical protein U1F43_06385 [Myxococcota bacterium]
MVTSGTNFPHLDALGHRLMAAMVDRVPQTWADDVPELPAWMLMPTIDDPEDTFGERTSTWAPMLGLVRRGRVIGGT